MTNKVIIKKAYCASRLCNVRDWKARHPGKTMFQCDQSYKRLYRDVPQDAIYCPTCGDVLFWRISGKKRIRKPE